jgi:uncharacterized membrane protein YhaH (DUF805 family)
MRHNYRLEPTSFVGGSNGHTLYGQILRQRNDSQLKPARTDFGRLSGGAVVGFAGVLLVVIAFGYLADNFIDNEGLWFLLFPIILVFFVVPLLAMRVGRVHQIKGWGVFLGFALVLGALAAIIWADEEHMV